MEIKIYTPESPLKNPRKLFQEMFKDLINSGELAWKLALRDINALYRQSLFGLLWALLIPLSNTFVWLFLSKSNLVKIGETDLPYPIFLLTGTLLWSILIDSINAPLMQVDRNKIMLAKINFPRESIILSGIIQTLFNALIKIGILIVIFPFYNIHPGLSGLMIPFGILSLILVGTSIGLILTPIGVLYQDISKSIPLLTQFLMYLSPVVYPVSNQGLISKLISLNPLSIIIINSRAWFTGQPISSILNWFIVILSSLLLGLILWIVYKLALPILIERMIVSG